MKYSVLPRNLWHVFRQMHQIQVGCLNTFLWLAIPYRTKCNLSSRWNETLAVWIISWTAIVNWVFFRPRVNWKRSFILMKRIQSLVWQLFLSFFSLLHALYFSNLIFKPEKSSRCWLYFFVLFSQVCWLSLHPKHVKLYDYISFAGKRVTYIW